MSLGRRGFGTTICRAGYAGSKVIVSDSCRCIWNGTKCALGYNASEILSAGSPEGGSCEKVFTAGECISGDQLITWTASAKDENGETITGSQSAMETGCTDGSETISCGEKLIKLPFFTPINIILVFLTLVVFYAFYHKNK